MTIRNVAVACALAVLAVIGSSALARTEDAPITDGQLKKLLQVESVAIASPFSCTQRGIDLLWNSVNGYVARADYRNAMASGELGASTLAYCAIYKMENGPLSGDIPDFSLSEWSAQVGSMLTISIMGMQKSGFMESEKSRKMAERAISFLTYSKQNGTPGMEKSISTLRNSIGTTAPSSEKPSISASAEALVTKFTNNSFGFDQQYMGKTIEAVGTVRNISGSRDNALVTLLGNKKKSKDDLGWQDEIACVVSDPKALQAAAELEKGKTYKVRGIYKNKGALGLQITLSNCEILK